MIYVSMPNETTQAESGHVQSESDKETKSIECIQHIFQQVHDILHNSDTKYRKRHDHHQVPHQFQVLKKVWLHLQKEFLSRAHRKLCPLHYKPDTITKVLGDNSFELNVPPFLDLHPMFLVDFIQPYFQPLLDTSDIAK